MKKPHHQARLQVVAGFFLLLLVVLIWRMVDLTITDRPFLLGQSAARSLRLVNIPAYRGMIIDREGSPLAVSTPVHSLWVNPQSFSTSKKKLSKLAQVLGIATEVLAKRIAVAKKHEFLYLQRQLTPMDVDKIEALKIPGLNFQQEFKRYYPEGDSVSQLIGFTNVDDIGIEGLELAYQQWLMGTSGQKKVIKDRMGRISNDLGIVKESHPGHVLQVSIDKRIQC